MLTNVPLSVMPGMMGSRSKESAWERGLKVSKRIREEVKRNEKSDEESEDSTPGTKVGGEPSKSAVVLPPSHLHHSLSVTK